MKRRYFGTDGVRGKVGSAPITPDFVMKLGQAAGRVLKRHNPTGRASVLIGKDTRVSGYMLEAALQAGFSSAGVDVVLCGPIPTPAVAPVHRLLPPLGEGLRRPGRAGRGQALPDPLRQLLHHVRRGQGREGVAEAEGSVRQSLPVSKSLSLWERCLRSRRRGQASYDRAAAQR